MKLISIAIIFSISFTGNLQAQKRFHERSLKLDSYVRTGKLKNGFTYYIRHNEEPKNRVWMYLVNKVGSVLEDEDQRGLAHFMEHMNFNGTTHFPHNELVNYLQKAGVRFGADINAFTDFDETTYELPLPSNNPEILHNGILIMHDWAHGATLDPTEIDKERGVVLEEKRLGKGAGERMQRQFWPITFNDSRYAERIPIGLDTVLENFKRPTIARFYKDWYRPDLQALIIAGDVNADSLERVIKKQFADLKNPLNERPRIKYTIPLTRKNHFLAVTDKEMNVTKIQVLIKHRGAMLKTNSDFRQNIIHELTNRMLDERFGEWLQNPNSPFVEGGMTISEFTGGLNTYNANVTVKPNNLENSFKSIWRETIRAKRFGFTETELQRAKAEYLSIIDDQAKEKDKVTSEVFVWKYKQNFLKGFISPEIEDEYRMLVDNLPFISLKDVNKLIQSYITDDNRDILLLAPDKDKPILPNQATIYSWMKTLEQENLQPYKDEVNKKPLLISMPTKGKTISKVLDNNSVYTMQLSNDIKVVLKPTSFRNNEIQLLAFAPGGTSLADSANYQSAANAPEIVSASGIGNYSRIDLDKFLSGKQVHVTPTITERFSYISGSSTLKDMETMLQMVNGYFTEPAKDTSIFCEIIERKKASLANRTDNPNSVFNDTVSAVLGNNYYRKTGPSLEKIYQINLDSAYRFYKERFANAADFTFVFVGNIDITAIERLINKYIASLPSNSSRTQAKDLGVNIPRGKIAKTVFKGIESKASVILVYSGLFSYNEVSKINLDAMRECLQIRLVQRLREEESGVYAPSVSAGVAKYPQERFTLVIQFGCAPENVEKLINSATDEVNKLRSVGPSQENIDKWRAEDKLTKETQLKSNSFWLNYLSSQLQNEEALDQISNYPLLREKLNREDVKVTAAKYLNGNNFIRIVLLPEKK